MPAKVMAARIESGGSKIESDRKPCHCIFHVFTHSDARMDWTEERMRYALCFFPLTGRGDRGGRDSHVCAL